MDKEINDNNVEFMKHPVYLENFTWKRIINKRLNLKYLLSDIRSRKEETTKWRNPTAKREPRIIKRN